MRRPLDAFIYEPVIVGNAKHPLRHKKQLSLADLLRLEAAPKKDSASNTKAKSVIMVWLGGGPALPSPALPAAGEALWQSVVARAREVSKGHLGAPQSADQPAWR